LYLFFFWFILWMASCNWSIGVCLQVIIACIN
jgi:hypothetical protein